MVNLARDSPFLLRESFYESRKLDFQMVSSSLPGSTAKMPINLFAQHFVETIARADGIIHIAMVNDLPQYSMQDDSGIYWFVVALRVAIDEEPQTPFSSKGTHAMENTGSPVNAVSGFSCAALPAAR
jgi:hypothetical protein